MLDEAAAAAVVVGVPLLPGVVFLVVKSLTVIAVGLKVAAAFTALLSLEGGA